MPAHHGHPSNLSRREIMRLGLGGLSALSISDLVRQRTHAQEATDQDTAVILVWLPGGHSHLETYDPKPQATSDFRGPYHPIKTVVPGMELCELLPHHARVADRFNAAAQRRAYRVLPSTGNPPAADRIPRARASSQATLPGSFFCHEQGTLPAGSPGSQLRGSGSGQFPGPLLPGQCLRCFLRHQRSEPGQFLGQQS